MSSASRPEAGAVFSDCKHRTKANEAPGLGQRAQGRLAEEPTRPGRMCSTLCNTLCNTWCLLCLLPFLVASQAGCRAALKGTGCKAVEARTWGRLISGRHPALRRFGLLASRVHAHATGRTQAMPATQASMPADHALFDTLGTGEAFLAFARLGLQHRSLPSVCLEGGSRKTCPPRWYSRGCAAMSFFAARSGPESVTLLSAQCCLSWAAPLDDCSQTQSCLNQLRRLCSCTKHADIRTYAD